MSRYIADSIESSPSLKSNSRMLIHSSILIFEANKPCLISDLFAYNNFAFSKLDCNPIHINLFQRTPRLNSIINKQDIIYIGGGNTKSMLAVWREWKLDDLLLKAYNRGAILCGVSAGAICWFEKGITDSWASNLNVMDCLGFIEGCCCPHYDGEKDRKPSLENMLKKSIVPYSYALDDGAALHYKNGQIHKSVIFYKGAGAYKVFLDNDTVKHELILSLIHI